jgi:hypothetical protein
VITSAHDVYELAPMASGHLLVLDWNGDLIEIDSGGHLIATHSRSIRAAAPALGLDQCTLLYASPPTYPRTDIRIARFDICTKTAGADFAKLPVYEVHAIRVLPTGDVLAATSTDVYRLNPAGEIVERYGLGYTLAIALTPDGRAFWAGGWGRSQLVRVPLSDSSSRITVRAATEGIANIAVVGEWRPPVPMRRRSARR